MHTNKKIAILGQFNTLSESILTYWPNQGGLFGGEATGKMQQTEVMETSKEELMEELMAKLKEDLAKGRKQVAAKEDTVESYVNISQWISNICRHSEL